MQAARGASLTPSDPTRTEHRRPLARARIVFVLVFAAGLAVDQVTKALAVARLSDHAPVRMVGDLLQLELIRNPGAAFSTGTGFTPVFSVLAIVAAAVVTWFGLRTSAGLWATGLGFLLAGVVGNLVDRMLRAPGPFRGHVVDFLALPHWPIFNVADVCINVAAVVIVIQAYRGVRLDGTRTSTS
jgi:signal peptidase II